MNPRNTIINELLEISPVVARIGNNNPFEVPEDYFEQFADVMLALVKADETSSVLKTAHANPYSVPPGYFEGLAGILLNRAKASEAEHAKEEIETLSPLLSGLNKVGPYSIPLNYFNESLENAADGVRAIDMVNEELEILSPLMINLRRKNVYEVPQGYFDGLADEVLGKVSERRPAKVVAVNFRKKVMRYAAAAVTAGLILFGGWFYINNSPGSSTPGFNSIPDQELQAYLEDEPANQEVSAINVVSADINEDDMKDMLADISDDELQKYVEQNGNAVSVTN